MTRQTKRTLAVLPLWIIAIACLWVGFAGEVFCDWLGEWYQR